MTLGLVEDSPGTESVLDNFKYDKTPGDKSKDFVFRLRQ